MNKLIILVEFDEVIADTSHRAHLKSESSFDGFAYNNSSEAMNYHNLCYGDKPIKQVIDHLKILATSKQFEIFGFTTRPISAAYFTRKWCEKHDVPIDHWDFSDNACICDFRNHLDKKARINRNPDVDLWKTNCAFESSPHTISWLKKNGVVTFECNFNKEVEHV